MKKVKLSDDLLPNWLKDDNEKRTTEYARNISDEKFLYYLNEILAKETIPITKRKSYPIIFFFGLPRCGKTFFSQMLVHALDLGYPDNIIAKFWKSPYFGIRLSRILQRSFDKSISFTSDFGKTANLFDPHDFAYYWQWLLRMDHFPYDPKPAKKKIVGKI